MKAKTNTNRCFLFLFSMAVLFMVFSPRCAIGFTTADLAGSWDMFWLETADLDGPKYWIDGTININTAGSITSGTWRATSGTTGTITGGALGISSQGELNGLVKLSNGMSSTISGGWMDASKTIAYVVTIKDTYYLASGILIKKTSGPFIQTSGTWDGFATEALGDQSHWLYSTMNVQSDGIYTGRLFSTTATNRITRSAIYMGSQGTMTGTYITATGATTEKGTMPGGKMDQSRQIGCFDYLKENGTLGTMIMINGDQTGYSTDNLQGDWAIYITEMIPTPSDTFMYWIKGTIRLSASGQLLSGDWESYQGTKGSFTSGTIELNASGRLSGTLQTSDNQIMRIDYGQLAGSKTCGACLLQKGDSLQSLDTLDYVFMIRKPSTSGALSNLMMLLLSDEAQSN